MSKAPALLIQFAKAPIAGRVKTRLMPSYSAEQACAVHTELLLHTYHTLLSAELGPVELWVAGEAASPVFDRCLKAGVSDLRDQGRGTLGDRMALAVNDGLARADKVVLVGSDCPYIDADYLQLALDALDSATVVFGAAEDGGYVLVGARQLVDAVFEDVSWGTDRVLAQSLQRAESAGLTAITLPALSDIDRPEDLARWKAR